VQYKPNNPDFYVIYQVRTPTCSALNFQSLVLPLVRHTAPCLVICLAPAATASPTCVIQRHWVLGSHMQHGEHASCAVLLTPRPCCFTTGRQLEHGVPVLGLPRGQHQHAAVLLRAHHHRH
jgi:hypothetical protein